MEGLPAITPPQQETRCDREPRPPCARTTHMGPTMSVQAADRRDEHYYLGVIDFLTEYSLRKKLEYRLKRLRYGHTMSCVPPAAYANRFLHFVASEMLALPVLVAGGAGGGAGGGAADGVADEAARRRLAPQELLGPPAAA